MFRLASDGNISLPMFDIDIYFSKHSNVMLRQTFLFFVVFILHIDRTLSFLPQPASNDVVNFVASFAVVWSLPSTEAP